MSVVQLLLVLYRVSQERAAKHCRTSESPRLETIHIHIIRPLNTSSGIKCILTMRHRGTGFLVTASLTDNSSTSVISALEHHYVDKLGVSSVIISDNGQEFNSHRFEVFSKKLGIHHKTTTAYPHKPTVSGRGFIELSKQHGEPWMLQRSGRSVYQISRWS